MRLILFLLLGGAFVAGCSQSSDDLSAYKGKTAAQIYTQARGNIKKGNYNDASHDLTALDTLYPFGPYARPGQLNIIYADYKGGDADMTIASSDRYLQLYPRGPNADYALYLRGLASFDKSGTWAQRKLNFDMSLRDLANFKDSYGAFARLVNWYPKSPYAANAIVRMAYLRNLLAKHELNLANYYWQRNSYVAAFNRASAVVRGYQGAPQVIPALAMMAHCDLQLGLTKEAKKTYSILAHNFPNDPVTINLKKDFIG
jgi:outer membrane protein assembly factor BamD